MSGDHNMHCSANTGGPAFPVPDIDGSKVCEGMTLRDYFAGKAMQGIVSREVSNENLIDRYAVGAYKMADAMLKARDK